MDSKNTYKIIQVYLRIVEAKGIKGADLGGTSDAYIVVDNNGDKKGSRRTSVIKETKAPKWNEEFTLDVEADDSKPKWQPMQGEIKLHLWDWNRVASHEYLDVATVKVRDLIGQTKDMWVDFSKKGSVRVVVKVGEVECHPAKSMKTYPSYGPRSCRVQLERAKYFPGETVRGAVVFGLPHGKPKPVEMRLSFEGSSSLLPMNLKVDLRASYLAFETFAEKTITVPAGCHVVPFEVVLPNPLMPSFMAECAEGFQVSSTYRVKVKHIFPKSDMKVEYTAFEVFPLLGYRLPPSLGKLVPKGVELDPNPEVMNAVGKPDASSFKFKHYFALDGPVQMWAGEKYTFKCKIANNDTKPIDQVEMRLVGYAHICAQRGMSDDWIRGRSTVDVRDLQVVSGKPNLPIAPGTAWEGEVTVQVPSDLRPSIHCTNSPLVQLSHCLGVHLSSGGNEVGELKGEPLPVVALSKQFSRQPDAQALSDSRPSPTINFSNTPIEAPSDALPLLTPEFNSSGASFTGTSLEPLLKGVTFAQSDAKPITPAPRSGYLPWEAGKLPDYLADTPEEQTPADSSFSDSQLLKAAQN